MTAKTRILVADAMPPLTLTATSACRSRQDDPLPRLGRLACVLAALALPALGIAAADTVHRRNGPKAPQAAAPVIPSDGAAVPSGAVTPARALRAVRTAALPARSREARS
jgi:hypothetical protein